MSTATSAPGRAALDALLEEIAAISHVPVPMLVENLEALGPRALAEPLPNLALARYMVEQQPRLKGCVEQVWRAVDLWLEGRREA
jgi:hypothetical protein